MAEKKAKLDVVYVPSENVVARRIEEELIIVPLVSGIGDTEEELYSLNDTGRRVWELLDGSRTLQQVVDELRNVFSVKPGVIRLDVVGLMTELLCRGIVEPRP